MLTDLGMTCAIIQSYKKNVNAQQERVKIGISSLAYFFSG